MSASLPPPLPQSRRHTTIDQRNKMLIGLAIAGGICAVVLVALRLAGLICPYAVPTGGMSPAISPGDHVLMEGFTFLTRQPRRGDIVVFKTDGVGSLPLKTTYVKRVIGEPGDSLRLANGKLYVNDREVLVSNSVGEIHYVCMPDSTYLNASNHTVVVPAGQFFVMGDNSTNSLDSRYWGFLPARNISGRVGFCYWPPQRVGIVE